MNDKNMDGYTISDIMDHGWHIMVGIMVKKKEWKQNQIKVAYIS